MPVNNPNVGVAFALVIGAGAATAAGAAVVFFPSLVKLASRRVLASALGISAGVMTYVSFVEIFQKSNGSFVDAGNSEEDAYIYATLCFFGGVIIMLLIDFLVRLFSGEHHNHNHPSSNVPQQDLSKAEAEKNGLEDASEEEQFAAPHCVGCSDDPVGELREWHEKAEAEVRDHSVEAPGDQNAAGEGVNLSDDSASDGFKDEIDGTVELSMERQNELFMDTKDWIHHTNT